jgi:hypothetical protein
MEHLRTKIKIKSKIALLVFGVVLFATSLFSQEKDEEAIEQLLKNESEAFTQQPIAEIVQEFWLLDEQTLMSVTLHDGQVIHDNKEALLKQTVLYPSDKVKDLTKTDHFIHINGNMAFASHEQEMTYVDTNLKLYSHELRILQKTEKGWKIHISSVHQYTR